MLHKSRKLTLIIMSAILAGSLLGACSQKESYSTKTTGAATPAAEMNKETEYGKGNGTTNTSPAADNKTTTTADAANQITIQNFAFKPANLTVTVGTKVTWVNKDSAPHTATGTNKSFNSNALDTNDQFSFVFNDKGDYSYFCALHPQMKGQITVK